MALADAYAIAYEFVPSWKDVGPVDLQCFRQNPRYPTLPIAQYTDDTQRSIGNARVLLAGKSFNPKCYIQEYIKTFKADPRDCYSRRYQHILNKTTEYPQEFAESYFNVTVVRQMGSNGSLMGVAPLGYHRLPSDVTLAAACQAIATHGVETVPYAQAIALKAHAVIYGYSEEHYEHMCRRYISTTDLVDWRMGPTVNIDMSAKNTYRAVMYLLHNSAKTLSALLKEAIYMGGDTDSVAAVAVAIASCSPEYVNDFPQNLKDDLESVSRKSELVGIDLALKDFKTK